MFDVCNPITQSAFLYRSAGGILAILTVSGPPSARSQSNFIKYYFFLYFVFSLLKYCSNVLLLSFYAYFCFHENVSGPPAARYLKNSTIILKCAYEAFLYKNNVKG